MELITAEDARKMKKRSYDSLEFIMRKIEFQVQYDYNRIGAYPDEQTVEQLVDLGYTVMPIDGKLYDISW